MLFSVVVLCQSLSIFAVFIWEESWVLSQSRLLLSQSFQLRRSTCLQKRDGMINPLPSMGLCTSYEHIPQCTSSNEIIAFSNKLMLFFSTTLRSIKISLKHAGKCTSPTSAFITTNSSASCKAVFVAGSDVYEQLGPGRSVTLLAEALSGMQGWSPALPPPPGRPRPGRCVTVTPSGFGKTLPCPRKERILRGSLIRAKLHFTASLSSCTAWSSSGDTGVISPTDLKFMCMPASESLHSG